MGNKLKNIGLVGIGMVAGVAASVQFSAMAQKGAPVVQSRRRCRWTNCASWPTSTA
jgi:hypothetical protein